MNLQEAAKKSKKRTEFELIRGWYRKHRAAKTRAQMIDLIDQILKRTWDIAVEEARKLVGPRKITVKSALARSSRIKVVKKNISGLVPDNLAVSMYKDELKDFKDSGLSSPGLMSLLSKPALLDKMSSNFVDYTLGRVSEAAYTAAFSGKLKGRIERPIAANRYKGWFGKDWRDRYGSLVMGALMRPSATGIAPSVKAIKLRAQKHKKAREEKLRLVYHYPKIRKGKVVVPTLTRSIAVGLGKGSVKGLKIGAGVGAALGTLTAIGQERPRSTVPKERMLTGRRAIVNLSKVRSGVGMVGVGALAFGLLGYLMGSLIGASVGAASFVYKKWKSRGKPYVYVDHQGRFVDPKRLRDINRYEFGRKIIPAVFLALALSEIWKAYKFIMDLYLTAAEIGQYRRRAAAARDEPETMSRVKNMMDSVVDHAMEANGIRMEAERAKKVAQDFIKMSHRKGDTESEKKWQAEFKTADKVFHDADKSVRKWEGLGHRISMLQDRMKG